MDGLEIAGKTQAGVRSHSRRRELRSPTTGRRQASPAPQSSRARADEPAHPDVESYPATAAVLWPVLPSSAFGKGTKEKTTRPGLSDVGRTGGYGMRKAHTALAAAGWG